MTPKYKIGDHLKYIPSEWIDLPEYGIVYYGTVKDVTERTYVVEWIYGKVESEEHGRTQLLETEFENYDNKDDVTPITKAEYVLFATQPDYSV